MFYSWSWGDNSEDIIEKPLNSFQKHTYYDDGEYTITIVVIDDDKERDREFFDNGEAVKEEIIKIKNVAPIIDNYSNSKSLIPISSKSEFAIIRKVYSDTLLFFDKLDNFFLLGEKLISESKGLIATKEKIKAGYHF